MTPVHEHQRLRAVVTRRLRDDAEILAGGSDRATLRRAIARALAAEGIVAAPTVWARMVRDLVDDLGGLGPVEALLRDPAVTEVMINGADQIYIERDGHLQPTEVTFEDDEHLVQVLGRVTGPLGVRLDRAHPFADAVLSGGIRLHAILPPLTPRPTITLRRVPAVVPGWDELIATSTIDAPLRDLLVEAVEQRNNVVVGGRAGVGKTTLLARLLGEVGDHRVVIIEDSPELGDPSSHCVHLRTRAANPDGVGDIDIGVLLRNALRMRPDRLVVGEVRGHEVADLLQAMNTGHDGSMTTVHANGPGEALIRLEGMALLAGIPLSAARSQVATAVDLVVALGRDRRGQRRVEQVAKVIAGPHGATTQEVWRCP